MEYKAMIKAAFEQEKEFCTEFLQRLVRQDTEIINMGKGGKEKAGQEIVSEILEGLNADVRIFYPQNLKMERHPEFNSGHSYEVRPNVVGIIKGSGGGRSLLINGHIDVVPAGKEEEWKHPPYGAVIEAGRLYGRGSSDMKAGLCAVLMALHVLKRCGIRLRGDVIIESVVDEEGGGNGTLACCLEGYHADAAIIPEPTELSLMPAHMGWLFYRIKLQGKPVHCAFKWNGENAVDYCLDFMERMRNLERRWAITKRHGYLPPPTICFTVINGGDSSSTVPGECTLDMSVHFHPNESEDGRIGIKIERELFEEIQHFTQNSQWLRKNPPSVEKFQQGSAYDIGEKHPIVECARKCLAEIQGKDPLVTGLASGADARLINNYADTPTLLCGPGSISVAHSVDEYVELQEYYDAIMMFCMVMIQWCGTE